MCDVLMLDDKYIYNVPLNQSRIAYNKAAN